MTRAQKLEALEARISALELDIACLRSGFMSGPKERAVAMLQTAIADYQQQIDSLDSDEQYERQAARDRLDGFARTKGKDWT